MKPRIAITTTADRGRDLADIVLARNCEPILLPCIETFSLDDEVLAGSRTMAAEVDRLIITSPRTVATLWPDGDMPDTPVASVGSRTAEVVRSAGGNVDLVGDSGVADLIAELSERLSGADVFFPHGVAADSSAVTGLQNCHVVAVAVYDTRPIAPGNQPVDAAIFGSPSAVAGWVLSRSLDDVVLAAIGSTTARALAERGHRSHVVADQPDYETLIDLVADFLTDRSLV